MTLHDQTEREILAHRPVLDVVKNHTQRIDDFLRQNPDTRLAVLATGGYGRSELCLHSDIDILFLHESPPTPDLTQAVERTLYALWNQKAEVGHSVRTLAQCLDDCQSDPVFLTALLEARFVCGDAALAQRFFSALETLLQNTEFQHDLARKKIEERGARLKKFGGSLYLLEPNVKEGEGGLRDIHLIGWLQKIYGLGGAIADLTKRGLVSATQQKQLEDAFAFFLKIRNFLHALQKKKNDQLSFAMQTRIAQEFGFSDTQEHLAVEQFMQEYYSHAGRVSQICRILLQKIVQKSRPHAKSAMPQILDDDFYAIEGQIFFKRPEDLPQKPHWLLKIFRLLQKTNGELPFETLEILQSQRALVNDAFRQNPLHAQIFREILADLRNLGKTFFALHDAKIFDAFIPEFRHLRNRVQHDLYHVYTVDTHSIFALAELTRLQSGEYDTAFPLFKEALTEIPAQDILSLGLLLHDIGKGKGGNHSQKGAVIARAIAQRLGYNDSAVDDVEFLVLGHLLLSHISQRRDLEDPHLIFELAQTLKTVNRLNMLFVLTWADIRAVSHTAWTDWKGTLLIQLYRQLRAVLENPDFAFDKAGARIAAARQSLSESLQNEPAASQIDAFLNAITPRYLLARQAAQVLQHFEWIQSHKNEGFFLEETPNGETHFSEIWLFTFNNPRVLSLVTGVMLAFDTNILGLEGFNLSQGFLLLKLTLQTAQQKKLEAAVLTRLRTTLQRVFAGLQNVEVLLDQHKKPDFLTAKPVRTVESRVDIDNDVSPYYTLIDVYAHDRVGLLYDILRTLVEQGCFVEISKISTKVDQVVDTFYVKDIFGQKIAAAAQLQAIQKKLLEVTKIS